MAILNLPRLSGDFPVKPDAGRWTGADGTLKQLGRALRVNEEKPFRDPDEPIRAIPDPWAQARTFGEALLDPRHSLYRSALRQWRGLLALFALQRFYAREYRIEPRKVELSSNHIFDRVLSTLPPEIAVDGQAPLWTRPWVMLLTGDGEPEPIGLSNPICLVSTGRRSAQIRIPAVAWAQGNLGDPLELSGEGELPAPQIVALQAWLLQVAQDLEAFPGAVSRGIQQLLQDYARDCRAELGGDSRVKAMIGDSTRSDMEPLFQPLFRPAALKPIADPASTSRTRLKLKEDLDLGPVKGLILADASVAALKGVNPRTCFVWGLHTLAELLRQPGAFQQVREEAADAGYWLVSAADFFTERAVQLANDPSIESHPTGLQDILLPLRPAALLLDGNLRDRVTGEGAGARTTVNLHVGLVDDNGGEESVRITRRFSTDPGTNEGLFVQKSPWDIYNASLWPNFRSKAWETYILKFVYQEAGRGKMARPHRGLSAALLAAYARAAKTGAAAVSRLQALNDRAFPGEADGLFARSERVVEGEYEDVQHSRLPFDAIAYMEGQGTRPEGFAGLVLIDLPRHEPARNGTIAAVDFGTTNTVAALAGTDAPPVTFGPRLVIPIKYKSAERTYATLHNARYLFTRFLPPSQRPLPTPTVAWERTPYPNEEKMWVFRNIIYFHDGQQFADNDEQQELKKFGRAATRAKFNLKWSEEPAIVEAATDYLEQFMVMTAAEALVAGYDPRLTRWRFSVPDAMSRTKREDFQGYLSTVSRRISHELTETDTDRALAPLYSEGLSAARYMISAAGFNPNALNIVLDIGGGTTDVTIWDRQEIRWRGSFLIAGQNFFTRLMCNNPQILREIGLGAWAGLFETAGTQEGGARRQDIPYLAEMLFSGTATEDSGLDLQRAIDTHWDKRLNARLGEILRAAGMTFIGGLAWYLGRVVKTLVAQGKLDPGIVALPAFSLCGRGAGLFKKMHRDRRPDDESALTRALQVYGAATGLSESPMPEARLTRLAKLEVVRGMLADDSFIDASAGRGSEQALSLLPAGLAMTYRGGGGISADELIDGSQIAREVDKVDLAELDAFLAELKTRTGLTIDLCSGRRSGARGYIESAVQTDFERMRRSASASQAPEPPFISALRALVGELAAPAKQREGRIALRVED